MTEDHKRLLAVFDVRVRDLMEFCDRQKEKINELESSLERRRTSAGNEDARRVECQMR